MLVSLIFFAREIYKIHAEHMRWSFIIDVTMSLTDKIKFSIRKITKPIKRFLQYKQSTNEEKITPIQALEWCQHFLRGSWSTITVEDMHIEIVPGGLSNYLYCCALPDNVITQNDEPRKVLLRIYGESHRQHRGTLLIDSVVCTLLSERKLGPHVYGIFPDGRIEEFIEAESLFVSEIRDQNISKILGNLLGEIHQLDMPLVKEPIWLYHTIEQYLSEIPHDSNKFSNKKDREIFQDIRRVCNFKDEFERLKNLLSEINSPVCFTHNDFQPGNILRLKSQPNSFTVIDFEYCSYNYRGFDIGNHFCEFMFDYKSYNEWPYFQVDFTCYPNEHQQMTFLTSYANVWIQKGNSSNITTNQSVDELIQQLMIEGNYYALASHFFWALWAIHMAKSTKIQFGYMEYARARFTGYYLLLDRLTNANDDIKNIQMPPRLTDDLLQSTKNPFHETRKT